MTEWIGDDLIDFGHSLVNRHYPRRGNDIDLQSRVQFVQPRQHRLGQYGIANPRWREDDNAFHDLATRCATC